MQKKKKRYTEGLNVNKNYNKGPLSALALFECSKNRQKPPHHEVKWRKKQMHRQKSKRRNVRQRSR